MRMTTGLLLEWTDQDPDPFSGVSAGGGRGEQAANAAGGGGPESSTDVGVLNAFYSSPEGVESRRKAAEWVVGGWQQPAD